MSDPRAVSLGGQEFMVAPQPLKVLKRLQPAVNRALREMLEIEAACDVTEANIDHLIATVALGLDVEVADLESIVIPVDQLYGALMEIFSVNKLEALSPNGLAAMKAARNHSGGTTSTPASPRAPDGDGPTSTT